MINYTVSLITVHHKYKEYADEKRILTAGSFVQLWKRLNFMCIIKIRKKWMKANTKCWTKISQGYFLHVIKQPPPLSTRLKHHTLHFNEHLILIFSPLPPNKPKQQEPGKKQADDTAKLTHKQVHTPLWALCGFPKNPG